MHRFFCDSQEEKNSITIKDKEEAHHIKVARLKLNDKLELIDGKGAFFRGYIQEFRKDKVLVKIETKEIHKKDEREICLACAIPKKAKMDYIIEKTTELGVDIIIPLKTERGMVDIKKASENNIISRWQKIAREATKQSKRLFVPEVTSIKTVNEVINESRDFDTKLIPTLEGQRQHLKDVLFNKKASSVITLIGPEGDFSSSEIDLAERNGFIPVSLGDFTLKVDTASIFVTGLLSLYLRDPFHLRGGTG